MSAPERSTLTPGYVRHVQRAVAEADVLPAVMPVFLEAARTAALELRYLREEVQGLRKAIDHYNGAPHPPKRRVARDA